MFIFHWVAVVARNMDQVIRNIFLIFIVSGFWHGANWTFIVWGALNALYFLPIMLLNKNRVHKNTVAVGRLLPNLIEIAQIGTTFFFTLIAWVFFRAESVGKGVDYISGIFSLSFFSIPEVLPRTIIVFIIILFILIEWLGRAGQYAIAGMRFNWPKPLRWIVYYHIILIIYFYGSYSEGVEFIYFQF